MPRATLNIDGHPADLELLQEQHNLFRQTDATGRPAVEVLGGEIHLSFYSTDDNSFFEWMAMPQVLKSGTITFYRDNQVDAVLRTLEFEDAYLIGFSESISATGAQNMTMSLILTARRITMGQAHVEKRWPAGR